MKKLIYITIAILSVWSCARFDDSKIWEEFENYYERLEKLEAACDVMNSNISALQAIVTALQGNDFVTGVAEIVEDGEVVGYTITFSKSGVVKIYHGEDGADGADGAPGADGRPGADGAAGPDGVDGENGHSPVVSVRKDTDGVYYWTIDGEWMLDDEGQKVPATGKDGADAENGASGKDGITPLLKIEEGYWFVSYDGGKSWTKLYKAVGENGADGADGAPGQDGADGKDGKDGDSFFQSVDTTSSEDYITLTLSDGTQIKLPTWKAFEELQTMVNKLNTNLSALQTIVNALQNNDYVTGINPVTQDGVEIGYTIDFAKSKSITIYHGKDGTDGSNGADGAPGAPGHDGEAGKDGYTPVLGVKPADDDWSLDSNWGEENESQTKYYWTLDGEWLLDENGNRIPASATNGTDGTNGSTGQNGLTPLLKITDGYWYVSLDGGQTWQPEPLGPATAGAGGSIFSDVTYDNAYLYITLSDGEQIRILRYKEDIQDYCQIDSVDVDGINVNITGHLNTYGPDAAYAKITLYYSDAYDIDNFNIYKAQSVEVCTFDYNQNFTLSLTSLEYETKYCYCIGVKVRAEETYSQIYEFTTGQKSEDMSDNEGIIIWSNEAYSSGVGLITNSRRAMAKIPAAPGDVISIPGLNDYTAVDFVSIAEDGTAIGYTAAASAGLAKTDDGTMVFVVPSTGSFTIDRGMAYVGLTIKNTRETVIDISTLPTIYSKTEPNLINARFDTNSASFIGDKTRLATTYIEIRPNRIITIDNIPDEYTDLTHVDFILYDSDKNYVKLITGTSSMIENTMSFTLNSSAIEGYYVRITMKCSSNSNKHLPMVHFINCPIYSK